MPVGLHLWDKTRTFTNDELEGIKDQSIGILAIAFIFSLAMYTLVLIPGANPVPPFLFSLALYIPYNHFHGRARSFNRPIRPSSSSYSPINNRYLLSQLRTRSEPAHTLFLIVGLMCLVVVNIVLVFDSEKTLTDNKGVHISRDDNEWGFGQVPALVLLVALLRNA
ncbi:hypothetical protein DFH08DRAFT_825230 [Mycena albidolilacea]|uniref:Uncharacterized protein n=1 Tax=Mycena albidolilacea TaxID=1033008 RepID=A0AAD6Z330_9AGAR|nr:hypothetical protein DFH08DRAFT_825230 [Mycena albidolilacea]